jgi:hypothetical protein
VAVVKSTKIAAVKMLKPLKIVNYRKYKKTQKYSGVDKNVHNVYTNKKFCGQKKKGD